MRRVAAQAFRLREVRSRQRAPTLCMILSAARRPVSCRRARVAMPKGKQKSGAEAFGIINN